MRKLFYFITAFFVGPLLANDAVLPKEERLLRYQEVFHHYYRKDELNALIHLNAGFAGNMISPKIQSNQLLLGALYNSYGLPNVGLPILRKVLDSSPGDKVKDLSWFYLAKQYFEEDNNRGFETAITSVGETLPSEELMEGMYMQGIHFLKTREFLKAEEIVSQLEKTSNWYQFLLFNLGAAYLKTNQPLPGIKYIEEVGQLEGRDEILLSLKDKANVVLGYHYLRASRSEDAVKYFQRVRLEGAFSDKALLGLGWAYSQTNQHRRALAPWLLLAEQDSSHIEVQEVLMAVPYTYSTLNSQKKSAELYRKSIATYESEKHKLTDAIGFIESASLFRMLFVDDQYDDYAISRQLKRNLKSDLGKMLIELLEKKELQEMLDEYRDLLQLQNQIKMWSSSLDRMNQIVGSVEDGESLPELSHLMSLGVAFGALPGKVARKVQYKETLLTLVNKVRLQDERLTILLGMYEQKIRDAVLKELRLREQYVVTYLSQTRYSLAELLDKSAGVK